MELKNLLYRRILVLLSIVTVALSSVFGQVPNGMKYQAVVRDSWGRIIEHKTVGVKIQILQYTEDGQSVFIEEHQKISNEYGLIYLVIGSENPIEFQNIDWSNGPYYIEVGIDIDGGINYEPYGTSELLSVPYALYALNAQNADVGVDTLYITDTTNQTGGFIANVVEDYGAIADGSTDNSNVFLSALLENTDVFVPSADENYLLTGLTIPQGRRLWFEQGAILDISGTISGNETEIIAGDYQIFTDNSILAGSWKTGIVYDSWCGNNQPIPGMSAMVSAADTTRWGYHIPVYDSAYSIAWDESQEVATRNAIYDKIESLEFSGGSSFIANVVDDYAAVGDGTTDNKQAFINALNENNDIFIPDADDNYLISDLSIPEGKRLWFERGAVIDVTGVINGDTTEIIAGDYQIFTNSSALSGSWKGGIAYNSWMGNAQPVPGMKAMVSAADTTRWGYHVPVYDSAYSIAWDESQEVATRNAIYDKIESLEISGGSSFIANVVDDYGAIGDGSTNNAQAFVNALNENNDIFIPNADSTYLISSLSIPPGKRLWFESNAKLDVTGTITGDSTEIIAGDQVLFTPNTTFAGDWKGGISYDRWSGKNEQIPNMSAMVTPADTTRWGIDTQGSNTVNYLVKSFKDIGISSNNNRSQNGIRLRDTLALGKYSTIFIDTTYNIDSVTFDSVTVIFNTNAMLNATGNVYGKNAIIDAGNWKLFEPGTQLKGSWQIDEVNGYWFDVNNSEVNNTTLKEAAYFAGLTTGNSLILSDTVTLASDIEGLYVRDGFVLTSNNQAVINESSDTYQDEDGMIEIYPIEGYEGKWKRESANWVKATTSTNSTIKQYDTFIPLSSTSNIEPGDMLSIYLISTDRDFYEVYEVSNGGVWVTTDIIRDYPSGQVVHVYHSVSDVNVSNLKLLGGADFEAGLVVNYVNKVNVQNVKAENLPDMDNDNERFNGIWLYRCMNFLVNNCRTDYNTYGIFITYGGVGIVSDCIGNNAWHCYESTWGAKDMQFSNCIGTNSHFVFRFHEETTNVTLNNIHTYGSEGVKFSGVNLTINGGHIRCNQNSTGRFEAGSNWGANLNAILIDGSFSVNNMININDLIIEGNYTGTESHDALVKVSADVAQTRTLTWNNCHFIFGSNGYQSNGSLKENFINCTFEPVNQSMTDLYLFFNHYNVTNYNPNVMFKGCRFDDTPDDGIHLKFPVSSAVSNFNFTVNSFGGIGTSGTSPIVMKGSDRGNLLFQNNYVNLSAGQKWIDASNYHPDMTFIGNVIDNDMSSGYAVDLESGAHIKSLSGNITTPGDSFINPVKLPVVSIENTTMIEALPSAPTEPRAGTMYLNSNNNHVYIFTGTNWKQLD